MDKKQIVAFLKAAKKEELLKHADEVREQFSGEDVVVRALIEFSNYCRNNCFYCGLRCSNRTLKRYRMTTEEIMDAAQQAAQKGIKTVVLQSGEDVYYTQKMVCSLIEKIKQRFGDMAVTLSIGERTDDDYRAFFSCGADRYLLKHETCNKILYRQLHPGQTLERRIKDVHLLRKIGYQVGIGNIIGLPGQSIDDIADDIMFFQEFQPDMVGIGPFLPQKDTPFASFSGGCLDLTLKVIALTRILTQDAYIPATTAVNTLNSHRGGRLALQAGADVVMVNVTPQPFRNSYRIYDYKNGMNLYTAQKIISEAGRKVSLEKGDSRKR